MAIRIGIIGTGGMANAHATEFAKIPGVQLTACCDVSDERLKAFAAKHGIKKRFSDYREMLDFKSLDAIANVTPDAAHAEVSLAAVKKGLAVLCEKPLATTLADAQAMAAAAKKAGVVNMVNFSYRNSCAMQAAAKLVRDGGIGRVLHVESSYLQSWLVSKVWGDWRTAPAMQWRLSTAAGSAGTLGDIGCHIYDLTTYVAGDISKIYCTLANFDKGMPGNKIGDYVMDANESFVANVTFANSGVGTVHSSRWATGQTNSLRCRVYGDKGAIELDLDKSYEYYRVCSGKNVDKAKWKTVRCEPTPNNYQRFVTCVKAGKSDDNDFANGVKIQAYLHYSFESAAKKRPVDVKFE
ncbi:MAG: Gfo/Idh/MocA family oxidoreductase [Phycisphaerae bacterium]|nr:Gfo/Idh/MocA family oxidoreductase [Phycisphaerae bacterium]